MMISRRGMGLTCTPPLVPTNTSEASIFGGAVTCCGDPSSPTYNAYTDPCSYFNSQPQLLAANAAQNAAQGAAGTDALSAYPDNVQEDAYACWGSPGASFTDNMGMKVNCPSSSTPGPAGSPISTYSELQLAQMLAPLVTPPAGSDAFNSNSPVPIIPTQAPPTIQPTQKQINTTAPPPQQIPPAAGSANTSTTTNTAGSGSSSSSSNGSTSSSSGLDLSALTNDSLISGVPNWAIAAGVVAALFLMGGKR